MLDSIFITKLKKTGIFVLIFTLLFVLFMYTLKYTLPFVLGFLIALSTKKFSQFLHKKFKISLSVSSIITTVIVFAILSFIVILVIYKITSESILLLANIPSIDNMVVYIDKLFIEITEIVGQIDPVVVSKIYEYLQTLLSQLLNITIKVANTLLSVVLRLPSALLIAVITFIATYLFSKDLKIFSGRFYSIFSKDGKSKMENIIEEGISMIIGYVKAYSLVVFITFVEVLVGLAILKIDFALILSILCALFDILPVIGMIMIFIPLIIYNFYIGNTMIAIGLIVLFLVVTIVRQIIEPKIVSQTLDMHPLMILAAIFIGLKVSGFVGMIYFIALLITYKVLVKVKVI